MEHYGSGNEQSGYRQRPPVSLRVCVLASGSKANSFFMECEDTRILIDVGIGIRGLPAVLSGIGERMERISAAFITHEHTDHVRGLPRFLERSRAKLFAAEGTLHAIDPMIPVPYKSEVVGSEPVEFGPFVVRGFSIPHDAADPLAYEICAGGHRVVVATDLGEVPAPLAAALSHASLALFESNHDEQLLLDGSYPEELKVRIASPLGHLSNKQCAAALTGCRGNGLRHVILAHISEENNRPDLAHDSAHDVLYDSGTTIHVTSQLTLGPLIEL